MEQASVYIASRTAVGPSNRGKSWGRSAESRKLGKVGGKASREREKAGKIKRTAGENESFPRRYTNPYIDDTLLFIYYFLNRCFPGSFCETSRAV